MPVLKGDILVLTQRRQGLFSGDLPVIIEQWLVVLFRFGSEHGGASKPVVVLCAATAQVVPPSAANGDEIELSFETK